MDCLGISISFSVNKSRNNWVSYVWSRWLCSMLLLRTNLIFYDQGVLTYYNMLGGVVFMNRSSSTQLQPWWSGSCALVSCGIFIDSPWYSRPTCRAIHLQLYFRPSRVFLMLSWHLLCRIPYPPDLLPSCHNWLLWHMFRSRISLFSQTSFCRLCTFLRLRHLAGHWAPEMIAMPGAIIMLSWS